MTAPAGDPEAQVEAVLDVLAPLIPGPPGFAPQRWPVFRFDYDGIMVVPDETQVRALAEQVVTAVRTASGPGEPPSGDPPVPRYEAGTGIRPASASRGRFRGIAREVTDGGGMELWACPHDHAPGVRRVQDADSFSREAALRCAEDWLAVKIRLGDLAELPVTRDVY